MIAIPLPGMVDVRFRLKQDTCTERVSGYHAGWGQPVVGLPMGIPDKLYRWLGNVFWGDSHES
jgi:hypothetical protein